MRSLHSAVDASLVLVSALACAFLFAPSRAHADWPVGRHDSKRTAQASGASDMTAPVPYFRTYLGGRLGQGQLLASDVDGDATRDVLMISGGRIVARKFTDALIWQTEPRGLVALVGVDDLDGDGKNDIVAYSNDRAYVFAAKTGMVEWTEPDGEMGSLQVVRMGDLDGDSKPDLVIKESGCGGVNSGKSGFAYSFGAGFGNAKQIFALTINGCEAGDALTLFDADGKPPLEVLVGSWDALTLLKGSDGSVLATRTGLGPYAEQSVCRPMNLDGLLGDELVCALDSSYPPGTNQHKAFALHYNAAGPALDLLWSRGLAPPDVGAMRWRDLVADLDGDGAFEVAVSGFDGTTWTTSVLDALAGNVLATTNGQAVSGSAALEKSAGRLLLTSAGTVTFGWTFARNGNPALGQRWVLPNRAALAYAVPSLLARTTVATATVATDLNNDGLDDLVTQTLSGAPGLAGYAGTGGALQPVGQLSLASGVDPQNAWVLPAITGTYSQIGLAQTNGYFLLLDRQLQPAKAGGEVPSPWPPIEIGGFYADGSSLDITPRVGLLDTSKSNKKEAVVAVDSRRALLRFDPAGSSWAVPPKPTWQKTHAYSPSIVATLDGGSKPAIACFGIQEPVSTTKPQFLVEVLAPDGTVLWSMPTDTTPMFDPVPATLDSDNVPDLAFQWHGGGDTLVHTRGVSGASGSTLWNATPIAMSWGVQPPAAGKWNGDGYDDVYTTVDVVHVLSGLDGAELSKGAQFYAYFIPTPYDVDGNGIDEVAMHGGYFPARLLNHDLTQRWASADDDRPYPYAAIASCPGTPRLPVLVEGSSQHKARLKLTPLGGAQIGQFTTMVLAGGVRYADEAAAANSSSWLGQITAASVHQNLTGKGRPTAVVGSSDGYLYGVDPCNPGAPLDFAVDFRVPVGEPVFGDTDGDGRDEILVGAADGYLYGLKNRNIASPTNVIDTDPAAGNTTTDVDTISGTDSLSGAWSAVVGATGYEIMAVTDEGTPLISAWQSTGTQTSGTISGLWLQKGKKYVFAVRALSAAGPSVDAVSNGVTVLSLVWDAGADYDAGNEAGGADAGEAFFGQGGGCGCRLEGSPGPWAPAGLACGLALFVLATARRRSRARSRGRR